jgi:hypothetical protein
MLAMRCAAFLVLVSVIALGFRWLSEQHYAYSEVPVPGKAPSLSTLAFQPLQIQARNRRVVYPYSVVPGGVGSAAELQDAALHDSTIAEHYDGFNYKAARIIEVKQPKLVYVSYRRDGRIFWTRKQASLRVGETLLTDGHLTARTRCGNQVSVLPQANVSPNEPTMAELDRPDAVASGFEQRGMPNLASDSLQVDPGLALHSPPGNAFSGGPPPTGFMPGPLGGGSGPVKTPTGNGCPPNEQNPPKDCQHNPPPPPPVPEPATLVLMFSGTAAVIARYRWKR